MAGSTSDAVWVRRAIAVGVAIVLLQIAVVFALRAVDQQAPTLAAKLPTAAAPTVTKAAAGPAEGRTSSPKASNRSGSGSDVPGIYVEFSPLADGSFAISERIVLRTPVTSLIVEPPARASAGESFARVRPLVDDLRVQSGAQDIADVPAQITKRTLIALPPSTSTILTLHYRLAGTTVMSVPSTRNRALAFIRPITAKANPSLPVQIHAIGQGTLNLICPEMAPTQQACARGSAPDLRVAAGAVGKTATVVVQLNVPS